MLTSRSPNYLTGNPLDRREDLRHDAGAFERLLVEERHVVVPVQGAATLVRGDDPVEALFVPGSDARELLSGRGTIALLGEAEASLHWLVEVDDEIGARLAARHEARFANLRSVGTLLTPGSAAVLVQARALAHFHRTHRWCGSCGAAMAAEGLGNWRRCTDEGCGKIIFPRTDPAIIVRVARGAECLLVRQPGWQPKQYATVAGFVEPGEALEEAVAREILEETGLETLTVTYHSSQPWPFPTSIMIGFDAEVQGEVALESDEIEDACWYTRSAMRTAEAQGEIRLPSPFSISRRLIDDWLDAEV